MLQEYLAATSGHSTLVNRQSPARVLDVKVARDRLVCILDNGGTLTACPATRSLICAPARPY